MSRRLSIQAKQEKQKPRVRFPDELVFLDSIKENDLKVCNAMLRKASLSVDLNCLNDSGLTPLHQAVLEGNLQAVKLLLAHGADVNRADTDTWTPLHAACAEGHAEIARYLLSKGARKDLKTTDGERALDLIDASDLQTIGAMLESDASRRARLDNESSSFNGDGEENASSSSSTGPSGSSGRKRKGKTKNRRNDEDESSSRTSDEDSDSD